jgi:hypothetical protein
VATPVTLAPSSTSLTGQIALLNHGQLVQHHQLPIGPVERK